MEKIGGNTSVDGSIGYCNQQAWIQNATLKNKRMAEVVCFDFLQNDSSTAK